MAKRRRRRKRYNDGQQLRGVEAVQPAHGILRGRYFPNVPREEAYRPHFGRSLTLQTIDAAIRSLEVGLMRRFTDIATESLRLDLHASALWQKRLNRLGALDWRVKPASGDGVEKQRAEDYAGFVRQQLEQMPSFRQVLLDANQATFHGRSAGELEWELVRSRWRVCDVHWIHARRLSFGPNRDLRIIDLNREVADFRDEGFALETIPYKFLPYKPRIFGEYPEREGLALRSTFWSFFGRVMERERLHLIEIFGKPWRVGIVKDSAKNGTTINQDQIDDAFDSLNRLGGHSTAVLPLDMDLLIAQPQRGAGEIHEQAIDHVEKAQSKLFLGGTATTDAVSTGLGSTIGDAHTNEEDLIIASDAWRLSEVIERFLTDAIIVVNFGPEAITHAPEFEVVTEPPLDRAAEAELIDKTLSVGVDIALSEARERLGVREIDPDEPYLRKAPRNLNGQVPAYLPQAEVIYPSGLPDAGRIRDVPEVPGAFPIGERPLPPEDPLASGFGDGPPRLPPAPDNPALPPVGETVTASEDELGDADIEALAAQMTEHRVQKCAHGHKNRCWKCGVERVRGLELDDDGTPLTDADGEHVWQVAWRPIKKVASARRLASTAPGSDGGLHAHRLDRAEESTALDGPHAHAYRLPGGQVVYTEIGGAHEHEIDRHGDFVWGGRHAHWLTLPSGDRLRTEVDGDHSHDLLVDETAPGGMHCHALVLPDGATVESLRVRDAVDDGLGLRATATAVERYGGTVCLAEQPSTVFGSPDDLMKRGVPDVAKAMGSFAARIANAVDGKKTPRAIRSALAGIRNPERGAVREALRRELLTGLMLGALDSAFEGDEEVEIEVETFSALQAEVRRLLTSRKLLVDTDPKFVEHPMAEAIRVFESREVVTPEVFRELNSVARQRAFTIAGLADEELLATARAELSRRIKEGADLANFRDFVAERLEGAGWTPTNASHVETIFRNNVQAAYSGGRWRQMSQPDVADARPYLQVLTPNDGPPRQRPNHQATHGKIFRVDDPAFPAALPPWDHNCRCRIRSLSKRQLAGRRATNGSWLSSQGLPAPGFGGGAAGFA